MASLFAVLKLVELQPETYLRCSSRSEQLRALSVFLAGYELALEQHDASDPGRNFAHDFGVFLEKRYAIRRAPLDIVRAVSLDDDEAWELLWKLFWEFRDSLEPNAAFARNERGDRLVGRPAWSTPRS